jgi:hypothetical protein
MGFFELLFFSCFLIPCYETPQNAIKNSRGGGGVQGANPFFGCGKCTSLSSFVFFTAPLVFILVHDMWVSVPSAKCQLLAPGTKNMYSAFS